MTIQLQEFIGETSEFYLSMPAKTFHLRAFTVGDSLWFTRTFGPDVKLETLSIDKICRLAYQLMEIEDKKYFLAKDVSFINEEGVEIVRRVGGPDLMFWQIKGLKEQQAIFAAILQSLSGSRVLEEVQAEQKKKEQERELIGQKSAISSLPSMDGLPKKSSHAHTKKFRTDSRKFKSEGH